MKPSNSLPNHQIIVVWQIELGSFSSNLLKRMDQNSVMLSIVPFMSPSMEQGQKPGEGFGKARAILAQKVEREDVGMDSIVPFHLAGLTEVFGFMSNYHSSKNFSLDVQSVSQYFPHHNPWSYFLCSTLCIELRQKSCTLQCHRKTSWSLSGTWLTKPIT